MACINFISLHNLANIFSYFAILCKHFYYILNKKFTNTKQYGDDFNEK